MSVITSKANNITYFLPDLQEEMVEVETEVQIVLLAVNRDYTHQSGGGHDAYHGASGGGYGGHPDYLHGAGSDSSVSSESERRCRCDQYTKQKYQSEQSMLAMSSSLIDLMHCQQQTQMVQQVYHKLSINPRGIMQMTP